MIAMLGCDVFPGLDRIDPLSSPDEDLIPEKFGPKWFNAPKEKEENFNHLVVDGEVDDQALADVLDVVEEELENKDS
jgi:hypothetical protein